MGIRGLAIGDLARVEVVGIWGSILITFPLYRLLHMTFEEYCGKFLLSSQRKEFPILCRTVWSQWIYFLISYLRQGPYFPIASNTMLNT